jgi:hypothetical protein
MRSPTRHLAELIDGFLATQLLYVAAKLDVADALAHGPLAPEAIAAAADADPVILPRVLRGLAALGILDERPDGRVALTTMGESLRRDAPTSMRGAILARGELYYAAGASLLEAARRGGVPFSLQHGLAFFEYLADDAGRSAVFQGSMTDRARQEAAEVVAAYNFNAFRRLVDVGGGRGVLLAAILNRAPDLRAVLLDQPAVVCSYTCATNTSLSTPRSAGHLHRQSASRAGSPRERLRGERGPLMRLDHSYTTPKRR